MIKVYLAAPYTKGDVCQNVRRVIDFAEQLSSFGIIPFVPHLTHFWHFIYPHEISFWYEYDNACLKDCDCLIRLSGDSEGADKEVELARSLGIPVVYSFFNDPDIIAKLEASQK